MADTRTPAQIAYEAYLAVLALSFPTDFAALPDTYRRAWDAAAQAVLAGSQPDGYQFAVGQAVRRTEHPQRCYRIHSRGRESTARGPEHVWYRLARQGYVLDRVAEDMLAPMKTAGEEDAP